MTTPYIIAIDYDGTLFQGSWPGVGSPSTEVIDKALEFKLAGAELVLWTCREGIALKQAIDRCREFGLIFDAINNNTPSEDEFIKKVFTKEGEVFSTRKIYADLYVDDRSPGSIEYFLALDVNQVCEHFAKRRFSSPCCGII